MHTDITNCDRMQLYCAIRCVNSLGGKTGQISIPSPELNKQTNKFFFNALDTVRVKKQEST